MTDEQKQNPTNNPKEIAIPPSATTEYVAESVTDVPNTNTKQTEKEHNSKEAENIKINEPEKKKDPSVTANNISRFAAFISLIVGGFTILLFFQTQKAVNIASKANEIADKSRKMGDSIGKANLKLAQDMFTEQKVSSEKNDSINKLLYQTAQKSADASFKSAGVAEKTLFENKKSAEFYRESVMNENRAYVIMFQIAGEYKIDSLFAAEATLQNVGKTPAFRLKADINLAFQKTQKDVDINNANNRMDTSFEITMGASQINYINTRSIGKVTKQDEENFKNNKIKAFAIIKVTYYDIFDRPHFTHGFWEYDFKRRVFIVCKNHNDAN